MNSELVSVVIPTYNRAKICCRAIDSALAQTYSNLEVLVIDDGSTDGSEISIPARYGDRIRYIRKANGGVSSARNFGVTMARGRFIAFLDSDDAWRPEKTQKQIDWLLQNPAYGMVLCDVNFIDSEAKQLYVQRRRADLPHDGWILKAVLKAPYLIPPSVMIRKEVLDDVGVFDPDLRTAEDLDFHLRVAEKWQIGVVCEVLVDCTGADEPREGLSKLAQANRDHIHVIERFVAARPWLTSTAAKDAMFNALRANARGCAWSGRVREGWGYGLRSINYLGPKTVFTDGFVLIAALLKLSLRSVLDGR